MPDKLPPANRESDKCVLYAKHDLLSVNQKHGTFPLAHVRVLRGIDVTTYARASWSPDTQLMHDVLQILHRRRQPVNARHHQGVTVVEEVHQVLQFSGPLRDVSRTFSSRINSQPVALALRAERRGPGASTCQPLGPRFLRTPSYVSPICNDCEQQIAWLNTAR